MTIMLFVFGIILLFAGFPLVLLPRVRLSRGWVVPPRVARITGGGFVGFFPAVLVTSLVLRLFGWDEAISAEAIYWLLFAGCAVGGSLYLWLAGRASRPSRQSVSVERARHSASATPPPLP